MDLDRVAWEWTSRVMVILFTGAAAVVLAFLVGDFAERVRGRIYRIRGRDAPEDGFRRLVTVVLAVVLVAWVVVAYG